MAAHGFATAIARQDQCVFALLRHPIQNQLELLCGRDVTADKAFVLSLVREIENVRAQKDESHLVRAVRASLGVIGSASRQRRGLLIQRRTPFAFCEQLLQFSCGLRLEQIRILIRL